MGNTIGNRNNHGNNWKYTDYYNFYEAHNILMIVLYKNLIEAVLIEDSNTVETILLELYESGTEIEQFYQMASEKNGELLFEKFVKCTDINSFNDRTTIYTLFQIACEHGFIPVLERMIEKYRIKREETLIDEIYPLSLACERNKLETVKYLISYFGYTREEIIENSIISFTDRPGLESIEEFIRINYGIFTE